uniref:Protein kinase domain-containing protein n=1 Tax=viral metagenome TaxID=1070528 RepID=A0A6C0IYG7_9ZZZZ
MASPENLAAFFNLSIKYAIQNGARIREVIRIQRTNEDMIIRNTNSFCPLQQIRDLTMTSEDVSRAIKEGFGDASILKSVMCLNNSLAIFPPNPDGFGRSLKVRQYLRNLKQIGGESVEGYAMTAEVDPKGGPVTRPFVVKSPRQTDPDSALNLLHEYFVGAFGTNLLRSRIPNFAFIMGFFLCAPPYLEAWPYVSGERVTAQGFKDRRALTYCQNDVAGNQVSYILYENVTDAVTLREFVQKGCSFEDWLNILTQVVLAEQVARDEGIDYTHYDLHDENVLVKTLPEEIYIQYPAGYLRTRYLAVIIDEGRAHIQYNGNHYGYALIEGGIYPDRSYPMFDIYKILMFSLSTAAFGQRNMQAYVGLTDDQLEARRLLTNQEVFQNGKEFIRFFYPDIERDQFSQRVNGSGNYLASTRKFFYSLPYSPKYNLPPIDFFNQVILKVAPQVVARFLTQEPPTDPNKIYGCAQKGICLTLQQALSQYTKLDTQFLQDPYVFYEAFFEAVEKGGADSEQLLMQGEGLYETHMNRLRSEAQLKRAEYEEIVRNLVPVSLISSPSDAIRYHPDFLEVYRRYVAQVVRAVDLMTSLIDIEKIMKTLNSLYPQLSLLPAPQGQDIVGPRMGYRYIEVPQMEIDPIQETIPQLNQHLQGLQEDVQFLSHVDRQQVLRLNPRAAWLFEKLPSIPAAVSYLHK